MIVYHASTEVVGKPDVRHSRKYLDFGQGFYVTALKEQAEKYAMRFLKAGQKAYLNVYELDDDWQNGCCSKVFESYNEEWLDFVIANRNGNAEKQYDAVEGGIADDKVFETVDLYIEGLIDKKEALRRLVYEKPNHQICFNSQNVIDRFIEYKETKIIKE